MRDALSPSDGALTRRYLDGDEGALEDLYRRHRPSLLSLYLHVGCDPMTAEDLAQEAFIRAVLHLDRFDPDRPMWPWLRRIAIHLHADHLRRGREVPIAFPDRTQQPSDLVAVEDAQPVAQALSRLTPRHREALRLRYVEDRKTTEAASALGVSVAAFNQLVFRARERLRDEYFRLVDGVSAAFVLPARWVLGSRARFNRDGQPHASIVAENAFTHVASGVVAIVLAVGGARTAPAASATVSEDHGPTRQVALAPPVDIPHPNVSEFPVVEGNPSWGGHLPTNGRLPSGGVPGLLADVEKAISEVAVPDPDTPGPTPKIHVEGGQPLIEPVREAACGALGPLSESVPICP